MNIICYYHDDMDGITAAAIVKQQYENDTVIMAKCQYGKDIDYVERKDGIDQVILVDFSFDKEIMEFYYKEFKDNFIWIDHHKTAIEKVSDELNSKIKGVRDITKSGCLLTWEYFTVGKPIPMAVEYANDYDMWIFNWGVETKAFGEYFTAENIRPEDERWSALLDFYNNDYRKMLKMGMTLLKAKQTRVEKSFEDGINIKFEGHKTRAINTNHDCSNVGEYCYKDKEYPVALIWSFRGDKIIIGLRSNTVDVGEIAKKHGGGGHKFASGFEISLPEFYEMIIPKG